jgi:hypothetical protein
VTEAGRQAWCSDSAQHPDCCRPAVRVCDGRVRQGRRCTGGDSCGRPRRGTGVEHVVSGRVATGFSNVICKVNASIGEQATAMVRSRSGALAVSQRRAGQLERSDESWFDVPQPRSRQRATTLARGSSGEGGRFPARLYRASSDQRSAATGLIRSTTAARQGWVEVAGGCSLAAVHGTWV